MKQRKYIHNLCKNILKRKKTKKKGNILNVKDLFLKKYNEK